MEKTPETQQAIDILSKFIEEQCCGKCISCREGTKQMWQMLTSSENSAPSAEEVRLITELDDLIDHTARCGLGIWISHRVVAILNHLGDINMPVEDYIPGPYQDLLFFQIDPEKCKGCSKCARRCPVNAVDGELKHPFVIDPEKCIRCGTCFKNCKFNAISIRD